MDAVPTDYAEVQPRPLQPNRHDLPHPALHDPHPPSLHRRSGGPTDIQHPHRQSGRCYAVRCVSLWNQALVTTEEKQALSDF